MNVKFRVTPRGFGKYEYSTIEWNLTNQLNIQEFLAKHPEMPFVKVGEIIHDPDIAPGYRIKVDPQWDKKDRLLYLLVIGDKIIKGGKVKGRLSKRTYAAGTEKSWTMQGTPSETNYVFSQIFRQCLVDGIPIEFYAIECPTIVNTFDVFGDKKTIKVSPYEEYESKLNKVLNAELGRSLIGHGNLLEHYKE